MRKDKAVVLDLHNCAQQDHERRKIVLKSAARLIEQASRELVLACVVCTLVVLSAGLLVAGAVSLLKATHQAPVSLSRHGQNLPHNRVSFVSLGDDCDLSARCRCSVSAIARLNPRLSCHVYNILEDGASNSTSTSTARPRLALLPNVQVYYNTSTGYFAGSPLDGWWRGAPRHLRSFAARVLALWRHGGASVDTRLVALQGAVVGHPADRSVLLEAGQGRVIGAPGPCHAFLFELMRALRLASSRAAVSDVIKSAMRQFCGSGEGGACPGVDVMPREMICDLRDAAPGIVSPELGRPSSAGEPDSNAIVVLGILSDLKNSSFGVPAQGLPFIEAAHEPRLKRRTCTWATLDHELLRLLCPASDS